MVVDSSDMELTKAQEENTNCVISRVGDVFVQSIVNGLVNTTCAFEERSDVGISLILASIHLNAS